MNPENTCFVIEDNPRTFRQVKEIIERNFSQLEIIWAKNKAELEEKWHSGFRFTISDYQIKARKN